jgi:hypothetical protein
MASQQCSLPQTWSVWNGISCFAGWLRHLRPCGHLGYVPLNIVYILVTKSVMTITNVHLTQLCEISLSPFVDNQTNAAWTLPPPSPTSPPSLALSLQYRWDSRYVWCSQWFSLSLTYPTPLQHALNMKSTCHLKNLWVYWFSMSISQLLTFFSRSLLLFLPFLSSPLPSPTLPPHCPFIFILSSLLVYASAGIATLSACISAI